MSTTILVPPAIPIIREVLERLHHDGANYAGNLVLFPGKRPGFFLRKAIADLQQRSFVPPRIVSMDEWVAEILRAAGSPTGRMVGPLDAAALLHDIHAAAPDRFGGRHFLELDAFLPLGMRMFAELEELTIAGCTPAQLREATGSIGFGSIHLVPHFFTEFYRVVRERGWTTRAMNYRRAAEAVDPVLLDQYRTVIVAGFFGLTESEQSIFRKMADSDRVTFLFHQGRGIGHVIGHLGLTPAEPAAVAAAPSVHFYRAPDPHGQVFALGAVMNETLSRTGGADEETVIVLPDAETLFPVFHQTLALLSPEQYNISLGYAVERTPVAAFFNALLSVVASMHDGRVFIADYLKFVLHPYTKNIRFRETAEATRILFHAVEDLFLRRPGQTYVRLEELEGEKDLFERVAEDLGGAERGVSAEDLAAHLRRIHDLTIRSMTEFDSIGDGARRASGALAFLYEESTAHLHPFFHPFAQRLLESLDALAGSLIAARTFADHGSYLRFLRSAVGSEEVHFPGTPLHGLQVLGFLETRSIRFRRVFLLDANDDILPGTGSAAAALLPRGLRERLHLETQADRERLYEYYLDVLFSGADEVHLFFTDDGRRDRSRVVERLLWERQKAQSSGGQLSTIEGFVRPSVYRMTLSAPKPAAVDKSAAVARWLGSFRYSASALDTYLACPLRFYYGSVLGLRERDEVSGEIDQADVGTLVHAVLQDFFAPLINIPLTAEMLDAQRLEAILRTRLAERWGPMEFGNILLMRDQIRRRLLALLSGWQRPLLAAAPIVVEDVEATLEIPLDDIRFHARVDRIERRGAGWHILDYKTGRDVSRSRIRLKDLAVDDRATWRKAIGSFQLPLYALMLAAAKGEPVERMHPAFVVLGGAEIDEACEVPLFGTGENTSEHYGLLRTIIGALVAEIRDPQVPFRPAEDLEGECPSCPFSTICGTQWIRSWNAGG